jgi:hypothetical protein
MAMKETYIKCPKCELNYITRKEKICPVCKQKMQLLSTGVVDHEKIGELGLCPICKINYITEDEAVCSTCYTEMDLTDEEITALYGEKTKTDGSADDDTEGNDDGLTAIESEDAGLEDDDLELLNVAGIDNDEHAEEETEEDESDSDDTVDDPLADLDESDLDGDDELDEDDEDDEDDEFDNDEDDDELDEDEI